MLVHGIRREPLTLTLYALMSGDGHWVQSSTENPSMGRERVQNSIHNTVWMHISCSGSCRHVFSLSLSLSLSRSDAASDWTVLNQMFPKCDAHPTQLQNFREVFWQCFELLVPQLSTCPCHAYMSQPKLTKEAPLRCTCQTPPVRTTSPGTSSQCGCFAGPPWRESQSRQCQVFWHANQSLNLLCDTLIGPL